ncbi:MAG TPA: GxxExxY protein [Gemmatales bacterium]|nr:GxxExxY protein [Gemmatales bacterium]
MINELTGSIIQAAIHVHRELGPGLLESVYHRIMQYEMRKKQLDVISELAIPVRWDEIQLDLGFRADLLVNNLVVVEIKSIEAIAPVHRKQVLTYLKLMKKPVSLLINFNVDLLRDGITRIVNGLQE